jgi:hypothetical protein
VKVIKLSTSTIIEGVPRCKGEFVMVADGFTEPDLIERTVAVNTEIANAAVVQQAEKHEEVRVISKELKAIYETIAALEIAMKEAELEKDPKIREELLKKLRAEMDVAEARNKELEEKLTPTATVAPGTVEEPKEEPKEEPIAELPTAGIKEVK